MQRSRFLSMALAAAAGLAAAASLPTAGGAAGRGVAELRPESSARGVSSGVRPAPDKGSRTDLRAMFGSGIGSWGGRQRRARPGWSNRQVQRMAAKRRNQTRHRRAARG